MIEVISTAWQNLARPEGAAIAAVAVDATDGPMPPVIRSSAPRRRATFLAGRRAARLALSRAGFAGHAVLGIGADGLPLWPQGWRGSISHTDDIALAIAAPAQAVAILGLDLERMIAPELAEAIAPTIMPEYRAGSGMSLAHEITRVFSGKEALYKSLFPQCRQFREFSAARAWWQKGDLHLALSEDWHDDWPENTSFQIRQTLAAGHVLSLLWY